MPGRQQEISKCESKMVTSDQPDREIYLTGQCSNRRRKMSHKNQKASKNSENICQLASKNSDNICQLETKQSTNT